jgi:hypothetical protein
LAVVMREFKSDTFNNINFDYAFEAIVYAADGNELAAEEELRIPDDLAKAARQKCRPTSTARSIY